MVAAVMQIFQHPRGAGGVLEDQELAKGAKLIPIGAYEPFEVSEYDWMAPHLISVLGDEAFIIAICARHRGEGAFRHLIHNIRRAGFRPVVVCPTGEIMPAIMKKWGWTQRTVGDDFESRRDEWRPPP
jgi:hypothetical protein